MPVSQHELAVVPCQRDALEERAEQFTLFCSERLPRKPYCSDDKSARLIRSRRLALRFPYISVNPPNLKFWIPFDIDVAGGMLAWEHAGLAVPNVAIGNPTNGHGHLLYGIDAPVACSEAARLAPLRFLAAVEGAYLARMEPYGADRSFAGLMIKNPLHENWKTLWGRREAYSLAELAEYIPDIEKFTPRRTPTKSLSEVLEQYGSARNVTLFNALGPGGKWAYYAVRRYRGLPYVEWHTAVLVMAMEINSEFRTPMLDSEIRAIAKSVAKWVWKHDREAEAKFIERQAWKGQRGGMAKGLANEGKRVSARLMRARGMSQAAIAAELSVCQKTVSNWLK